MSRSGAATPSARRVDGLGRRLLIGIVVASSAITLIITAVEMGLTYRSGLGRIESSIDLIETSYVPTLVNSLWTFDETQTVTLLRGVSSLPDMEYLRVVTAEGTIHEVGQQRSARVVERTFPLVHETSRRRVEVGKLTVVASVDRVLDRLLDRLVFIVASNALKTSLVAAFALYLFHMLVTRHLNRIVAYSEGLEVGEQPNQPLRLARAGDAEDSLGLLEASLNATWRRLAEDRNQLRASERRFRDLVDGSLQGILIHDGQRVLYANAFAAGMLGYPSAQALQDVDSLWPLVAESDRPRLRAMSAARLAGRPAPERYEARWLRADGTVVVVDNGARRVDWFGARAVQTTLVDVTARVDAEHRLRTHQANLESLIEARTADLQLAQEELVQSERLSTIGRMTATVSHELRNPLGTLSTSVATLRRNLEGRGQRVTQILDRIDRSVWRCTAIIEDLLEFVHVPHLALQPLETDPWVESVLRDFSYPAGVSWTWQPGKVAPVRADARRLEQCLSNLLHNACQCMLEGEGGGGELSVATRQRDGRVEILVTDTGPGVPEALRQKIFEPLFSTRGFGIGLGLPLVRQIMEHHGGGVEVGDWAGPGARFVLWLPVAASP